ncbi:hypothetical protein P3X46_001256 [Hevea brasiliensis]|uniref:Protein kinase domain-containing protein n=1 Tax=Hevea brasiliensis TaxID=3981 RepID=A0ABQ9NCM5_HEVBR|nr:hypothetical protein P3X46_001256 [Hevea brasiliensis]
MEWVRWKCLGKGSYGSVFLALPTTPVLLLLAIKGGSYLHFFGSEGIVRCYGACLRKIPECDVRQYTWMILKGLSCIHKNGYVHCDLNLGLAKELGEYDSRKFYTFRGTALYTSPESVGLAKISSALDIWSLGCVVIEMITREPPCKELGIQYLIIRLAFENRSPEIPESVSKKGKDFLNMCFMRPHCERWIADMLLNHPFIVEDELTSPVDHPLKELPQTSPSILSSSSYDSPG